MMQIISPKFQRLILFSTLFALMSLPYHAQEAQEMPTLLRIASNLNNPRGVAVLGDGQLLVVEAGLGNDIAGEAVGSGQISRFDDLNHDGDFDDEGERSPLISRLPSYNSLPSYRSGHDEPFGLGDILVRADGRIFFTKDDPFFERGHPGTGGFYGDVGIFELREGVSRGFELLVKRIATINAIAYDEAAEVFYMTESGFNRLSAVDATGEVRIVAEFPPLAHQQQAVPSGVALDPLTGDVLVALFSGFVYSYSENPLSFMPYDSKVVRVNPTTGEISDAVTGLTTAIDVALDAQGNLYVLQLTSQWATAMMPFEFDLNALDGEPDPGGYVRYSGRLTLYPVDGSDAVILADGLDNPTNLTLANDALYISTGLGTPNRPVISPMGIVPIEGVLYRMDLGD